MSDQEQQGQGQEQGQEQGQGQGQEQGQGQQGQPKPKRQAERRPWESWTDRFPHPTDPRGDLQAATEAAELRGWPAGHLVTLAQMRAAVAAAAARPCN